MITPEEAAWLAAAKEHEIREIVEEPAIPYRRIRRIRVKPRKPGEIRVDVHDYEPGVNIIVDGPL